MVEIILTLGEFFIQTIIPLIAFLIIIITIVLSFEKHGNVIGGITLLPFYLVYEFWYIIALIVGAFFGYRAEKTLYAVIGGSLFFLISSLIIVHLVKYHAKKYHVV